MQSLEIQNFKSTTMQTAISLPVSESSQVQITNAAVVIAAVKTTGRADDSMSLPKMHSYSRQDNFSGKSFAQLETAYEQLDHARTNMHL